MRLSVVEFIKISHFHIPMTPYSTALKITLSSFETPIMIVIYAQIPHKKNDNKRD